MRGASLVLGAAVVMIVAPRPAEAQADPKKQAVKLIGKGDALFKKGDYAGALARYQEAYQIFPSPKIFYAMAKAEEKLGKTLEALGHYEQFLAEAGEDVNEELRVDAQVSITELEKTIVVLGFDVRPIGVTISVDDETIGESPWDKPVRLLPGAHKLTFAKQGFKPVERQVEWAAGDRPVEQVALEEDVPDEPDVAPDPIRKPPPPESTPKRGKGLLYTGLGVTGALAVSWIVTGVMASGAHAEFSDESLPGPERADARDRGKSLALTSDVLLGSTVLVGGLTALYYFKVYKKPVAAAGEKDAPVDPDRAPPPPGGDDDEAPPGLGFVPLVGPGGVGAAVFGTF